METIGNTINELNVILDKLQEIATNYYKIDATETLTNNEYMLSLCVGNALENCIDEIKHLFHNEL